MIPRKVNRWTHGRVASKEHAGACADCRGNLSDRCWCHIPRDSDWIKDQPDAYADEASARAAQKASQ